MSRNSMSGKVTLKVSLSDALQNAGGRKPSCPSAYPTTMTRNTGRVAFRLKIKFCMAVLHFLLPLFYHSQQVFTRQGFCKIFFGKSLDFSGVFVLEYPCSQCNKRKCWNRQTGTFEVRVSMTCGFKSHLPRKKKPHGVSRHGGSLFPVTQTKQSPRHHHDAGGLCVYGRTKRIAGLNLRRGTPRAAGRRSATFPWHLPASCRSQPRRGGRR